MVKSIIFTLFFLIPLAALSQDEVRIQIALDKDTININEQAYLTVTISGSRQNMPQPDLPNLTMFNIYSQGTSTNISWVNGKMQASYSYQFLLQPKREGTYPIRPVTLVYNNKMYSSNELSLTVLNRAGTQGGAGPTQNAITTEGASRDIFLTADVDKRRAYVNEQITLTVKFYHAVQLYSQPEYNAPQTTDFWTNMLDQQKSYYQIVNGQRYQVSEISTALFPTRSGDLAIGSAMVTAAVPVKRAPRRNDPFSMFDDMFSQTEQRSVRSNPISIKVIPLPDAGKPTDFSGTVGNYTIDASPDKISVDMNQPVTVTYKISGTGNIKTIAEPNIAESQDFRIYRASSDEKITTIGSAIGGTKIFEETYIPKRAGNLTIPPVKLDFFDPGAKKYRSITARPVALNVRPIESGDMAGTSLRPAAGMVVDPNAKDIRYIKTDPGQLDHKEPLILFSPIYLILNGLPVIFLAVVWIGQKRREKLVTNVGYARSRAARKLARKHLSSARHLAAADKAAPFYAELRRAMFSYVADKRNISAFGLTGENFLEILKESGFEESTLEMAGQVLKQADFAQYSSADIPVEQRTESLRKAEEILIKMEGMKFA